LDNLVFSEYFHGDNGAGLGASHQTGWTGLVADLIRGRPGEGVFEVADLPGLFRSGPTSVDAQWLFPLEWDGVAEHPPREPGVFGDSPEGSSPRTT
jgi:hypothetical protein